MGRAANVTGMILFADGGYLASKPTHLEALILTKCQIIVKIAVIKLAIKLVIKLVLLTIYIGIFSRGIVKNLESKS